MEGDLTSEFDASIFDFDFDSVDLIDNPLSQAHPNNQENSTPGNSSDVLRDVQLEHVDTGSASGNSLTMSNISGHNVTSTTNFTVTGHLDASPEIAPNILLPVSSSISLDTLIGTPQAYNQTTVLVDQMNTNPSLPGSTNQPLINNATNNFSPSVVSSFNSPFSGTGQPYFPPRVETIPQINEVMLTQLNTPSGNELLFAPPMSTPLNLSNSLLSDNQSSQNIGNSYFLSNSNQQAVPYPTSFPQIRPTGSGIANGRFQINQQPPTCLPNYQTFPYNAPLTPSRPLINQQLAPNVQSSNSMLPGSAVPLRRQHVANQQQAINQVQGDVYNPQRQCYIVPENSTLIRLPLYQLGVAPDNPIMPSDGHVLILRGQELPNHRPINQAFPIMPNVTRPQINNPLLLDPSMNPRGQELPNHGPINQAFPMMPNTMRLQLNNSLLDPSMDPRLTVTYSSPGSSQLTSNLNPMTQQQAFVGQQRRGQIRSRYEAGESSAQPKRARRDSTGQGGGPQLSVSQSQEDGTNNHFNSSRPTKNVLYDPLYETIGLPVDPHLRCFARMNALN